MDTNVDPSLKPLNLGSFGRADRAFGVTTSKGYSKSAGEFFGIKDEEDEGMAEVVIKPGSGVSFSCGKPKQYFPEIIRTFRIHTDQAYSMLSRVLQRFNPEKRLMPLTETRSYRKNKSTYLALLKRTDVPLELIEYYKGKLDYLIAKAIEKDRQILERLGKLEQIAQGQGVISYPTTNSDISVNS